MCIVAEEIARICGGFAIGVMASVLAPPALVQMSGRKQRDAAAAPPGGGPASDAGAST